MVRVWLSVNLKRHGVDCRGRRAHRPGDTRGLVSNVAVVRHPYWYLTSIIVPSPMIIATWPSHTARSPGTGRVTTPAWGHQPGARHWPGVGAVPRGWCRHRVRGRWRFVAEPGEGVATRDLPSPWRFPGV